MSHSARSQASNLAWLLHPSVGQLGLFVEGLGVGKIARVSPSAIKLINLGLRENVYE